jgi:hypothetical protein
MVADIPFCCGVKSDFFVQENASRHTVTAKISVEFWFILASLVSDYKLINTPHIKKINNKFLNISRRDLPE